MGLVFSAIISEWHSDNFPMHPSDETLLVIQFLDDLNLATKFKQYMVSLPETDELHIAKNTMRFFDDLSHLKKLLMTESFGQNIDVVSNIIVSVRKQYCSGKSKLPIARHVRKCFKDMGSKSHCIKLLSNNEFTSEDIFALIEEAKASCVPLLSNSVKSFSATYCANSAQASRRVISILSETSELKFPVDAFVVHRLTIEDLNNAMLMESLHHFDAICIHLQSQDKDLNVLFPQDYQDRSKPKSIVDILCEKNSSYSNLPLFGIVEEDDFDGSLIMKSIGSDFTMTFPNIPSHFMIDLMRVYRKSVTQIRVMSSKTLSEDFMIQSEISDP